MITNIQANENKQLHTYDLNLLRTKVFYNIKKSCDNCLMKTQEVFINHLLSVSQHIKLEYNPSSYAQVD